MKRALRAVCLLAALCGLTSAVGLAEPLAAAHPEGAGAENAHCPDLVRMREGCFRGEAALATPSDLEPLNEELPYLPAPLLGPLWDREDALPASSETEPIDQEWEVYRRWIEGRWYHDSACLPEEDPALWSLVPQIDIPRIDVEQLVRSAVAAVRSLAVRREEGLAASIQRAADHTAALGPAVPAIAEPRDIYASEYYPGEEPASDNWYDENAEYGSDWNAESFGDPYDSYGDLIEGELGGLDDGLWGQVREFGDEPADTPWYLPADDAAASDESPADRIPYELPEGYDFSAASRLLHRLRGHWAGRLPARTQSIGELVLGVSPSVPENALALTPAPAELAERYAAEYVPEYEAPADDRFWEGSWEADDAEAESVIPYRDDNDDLPADPESGESYDASPLESALHFEVRPRTGRAVVDQGAVLAVPLARIEACQVWIAELLGSAPVLHARSELSAACLSLSAALPSFPRPRLSLLRTSPERPAQPVSLDLPHPRRLLAGPAVVLERMGTALHDLSTHLAAAARGGEALPPGARRNSDGTRR